MSDRSRITVQRFSAGQRADFFRLHDQADAGGWCYCVAWWVPTWQGWGERSAAQNRALREQLCERGEYDGYLIYVGDEAAGWCQAGPRDRLAKLAAQFQLPPEPDTWAISCFFIAPAHRQGGLARYLLAEVLADLRTRGVRRVEAYPKRGDSLEVGDLWNGPEALFRAAGFSVVQDHPQRPVLACALKQSGLTR